MTPTTEPIRLALAPQGVFRTIQGEGLLLGVPRATGDEKEDLK